MAFFLVQEKRKTFDILSETNGKENCGFFGDKINQENSKANTKSSESVILIKLLI